jgi:DNA repair photolyase
LDERLARLLEPKAPPPARRLEAVRALSDAGIRVGVNLMPWIRGERLTRPPVFGEQTSQEVSQWVRLDQQVHPENKKYMTITQDGYKLIYNRDVNSFELYDLTSDPAEQHTLRSLT